MIKTFKVTISGERTSFYIEPRYKKTIEKIVILYDVSIPLLGKYYTTVQIDDGFEYRIEPEYRQMIVDAVKGFDVT